MMGQNFTEISRTGIWRKKNIVKKCISLGIFDFLVGYELKRCWEIICLFLFLPDPQLMKFDIKEDHLVSPERLCWNIFQHGFEIEYLYVQVHLVYTNQPIIFFLWSQHNGQPIRNHDIAAITMVHIFGLFYASQRLQPAFSGPDSFWYRRRIKLAKLNHRMLKTFETQFFFRNSYPLPSEVWYPHLYFKLNETSSFATRCPPTANCINCMKFWHILYENRYLSSNYL